MGRDARLPRAFYTEDAKKFQHRHPFVFPFIQFVVAVWVAWTTGTRAMAPIERLLLWVCILEMCYRFMR